jgi:hypothetical protein
VADEGFEERAVFVGDSEFVVVEEDAVDVVEVVLPPVSPEVAEGGHDLSGPPYSKARSPT